jgi:vacuolar-type H+-ATPase subunit I/STV1
MSKKIQIDITVDTAALPKSGGTITRTDVIEMVQDSGQFKYENDNKAKLISILAPGTEIKWKIKSLNNTDKLELLEYLTEDNNMSKVFKQKPGKTKDTDDEFNSNTVDDTNGQSMSTQYTFTFCKKNDPDTVWQWDPRVDVPYPPAP